VVEEDAAVEEDVVVEEDVEEDDDDAKAVRPGDVLSYSVHKLHERLDEVNEGSWVSLGCYHWHSL